jgi:hypothetical protein
MCEAGGKWLIQGGWHMWILTTWRVEEGASHMGQFNAGMGLDQMGIRVHASINHQSKLFMLHVHCTGIFLDCVPGCKQTYSKYV